jgi:hypothetical protein
MTELSLPTKEFYGMSYKRLFGIPKHGRFQAVLFPADKQTMTDRQAAKEINIWPDSIILLRI